MKQITIYERLETTKGIVENGYVAFDSAWYWDDEKPERFNGEWEDRLFKIKHKDEE